MDDETLLAGLHASDPAAISHLRARYRGRLIATIARICGDRRLAAEMSDDILADFVLDHAPRLRAAAAASRYLHLMAVRRAVRHRDRGHRHDPLPPALVGDADPATRLDAALDAPVMRARLADCLAEQPQRTQHMLRMRYGRDATLAAIGDALDLSKQFVGRTLTAALAALRRCLVRAERTP